MATLAAAASRQATNSLCLSSARTAGQTSSLIQRRGRAGATGSRNPKSQLAFALLLFPISFLKNSSSSISAHTNEDPTIKTMEDFSGYPIHESYSHLTSLSVDAQTLQKHSSYGFVDYLDRTSVALAIMKSNVILSQHCYDCSPTGNNNVVPSCLQRRVLKSVDNIKRSVYRLLNIGPGTDSFNSNASNLQVFRYTTIKAATNNFSSQNKLCEGGFGPVYKELLGYVEITLADVVHNGRINQIYHLINSKNGVIHVEISWKTI